MKLFHKKIPNMNNNALVYVRVSQMNLNWYKH